MSPAGYFPRLTKALREAAIHRPCLVLDRGALDRNIARVKDRIRPGISLRIVDKSLPCIPLMRRAMAALHTGRVMTFHAPVSLAVLEAFPDAELLGGKPMPVGLARQMIAARPDAVSRLTWLIDTQERLAQYAALAAETGHRLAVCLEVDIGLHRGGFGNACATEEALREIARLPSLRCAGLMGYEAHIGKIPRWLGGPEKARRRATDLFKAHVDRLAEEQRTILNTAGSTTALLYGRETSANEVSMGSAFVQPTDFDVESLQEFEPAIFIAAPVLKVGEIDLPGLDARSRLARRFGLLPRRGCYLYGGKWMARPAWPQGLSESGAFGRSTNQQFYALPHDARLSVDDYAFFRPTQSELVMQQFGTLQVYENGDIVEAWPTIPMG